MRLCKGYNGKSIHGVEYFIIVTSFSSNLEGPAKTKLKNKLSI